MVRRRNILKLVAAVMAVAFAAGLYQLLLMRFDTGDVYAPYSTLRSDAVGSMALYESLQDIPGLAVERNFKPLERLRAGKGATLLIIGSHESHDDADDANAVLDFAHRGGRVVGALHPAEGSELLEAIALRLDANIAKTSSHPSAATTSAPAGGSTAPISWHSTYAFGQVSGDWTTLYATSAGPAVIERPWGEGSVVLLTDAYLLSNEAMVKERRADVLSLLLGGSTRIVFDETHLGVLQESGITTLARNYGMEGVLAALVVLAALSVWRLWASFVPRSSAAAETLSSEAVGGRGAWEGLVNLLRRTTAPSGLLKLCLTQWSQCSKLSETQRQKLLPKLQEIVQQESLKPRRKRDPLQAYQEMCRLIAERK